MKIGSDKNLHIIEKLEFDAVNLIFHALDQAFHPDGLEDEEVPNPNFLALWTLSLTSAGWTEDEFWAEFENQECTCDTDHDEDSLDDDDQDQPLQIAKNKLN